MISSIRTIYKVFSFYVPFIQLLKLSKNFKSRYSNLKLYKKIENLIFSKELISSIQLLAQDPDHESVIHLPEEDEFLEILQQAVNERMYDPYTLLEKRVIQGICIEKLIFSD